MTSFIHQTDLFHPHGDPDDHWDLATVYALAAGGRLDLRGIMLDYPPAHRAGDPATLAVAQMENLSGIAGVPTVIGTRHPLRHRRDTRPDLDADQSAAEWLCRMLQESPEPVVVSIVGSCTDVALAGLLQPELFASRCRAIYLSAGAAHPGPVEELDNNVKLNPGSYAAVFDLPCPVYWCPCWHRTGVPEIGPNGTWYSFVQGDIFEHLSDPLCNFFLYMLSRSSDPQYLRYLTRPVDAALKAEFGLKARYMWSTAGIMHAAGLGVDAHSGLLPVEEVTDPVFEFLPVTISCDDEGRTSWEITEGDTNRYIFHLPRPEAYAGAMTSAMRELLSSLGGPGAVRSERHSI